MKIKKNRIHSVTNIILQINDVISDYHVTEEKNELEVN